MKYRWRCKLCKKHEINGGMVTGMSKSWSSMSRTSKSLRIHSDNKHNGTIHGILIREDGVTQELKK